VQIALSTNPMSENNYMMACLFVKLVARLNRLLKTQAVAMY